jgi:hypothetical protein
VCHEEETLTYYCYPDVPRYGQIIVSKVALPLNPLSGSKTEVGGRNREVRFTPESRLNSDIPPCLKSAQQTHALHQLSGLFDHFVGASEHSLRDREPQGLGGGQVFEICVEPGGTIFYKAAMNVTLVRSYVIFRRSPIQD